MIRNHSQKYLWLTLLVLIVSLLGRNYVNSQIVDPRMSKSGVFTVNITVSNAAGCAGTVTPPGSQLVAAGTTLELKVDPKDCKWTYNDDRGGNGTGASGVKIIQVCQDINATIAFLKPTPTPIPTITLELTGGVQVIGDGKPTVTPLDPNKLFPSITPTPSCLPVGAFCDTGTDCCSGSCDVTCYPP